MADIKTLKDNETRVLPRTTSAAIMNDNGEPIENDINSISAPVESAMNTLNTVTGTSVDDVAQSLAELQNIKKELKTAISEKGQDVGDVFSEYPNAIRAIKAGSDIKILDSFWMSSDNRLQAFNFNIDFKNIIRAISIFSCSYVSNLDQQYKHIGINFYWDNSVNDQFITMTTYELGSDVSNEGMDMEIIDSSLSFSDIIDGNDFDVVNVYSLAIVKNL